MTLCSYGNWYPADKKAFIEAMIKLARQYNITIGVATSGEELYIRYEYDDEDKFYKFLDELKKFKINLEFIFDKDKRKSYTV